MDDHLLDDEYDLISLGRPLGGSSGSGVGLNDDSTTRYHYYSQQQETQEQQHQQQQYQYDSTTSSSSSSSSSWGHYLHDDNNMDQPSVIGTLCTVVWNLIVRILDFITGPNFGLFVSILVIFGYHYRSNLQDIYYSITEDGLQQTLLDLVFSMMDVTRAYIQIVCELLRSFRQHYFFDGSNGDNYCVPYHNNDYSNHSNNASYNNNNNNRNNRMGRSSILRGIPASSLLASSYGSPPPLVMVDDRGNIISTEGGGVKDNNGHHHHHHRHRSLSPTILSSSMTTKGGSSINRDAIEPAFLNECDYPKGWLVYHPVLGVVPKEDADQYDEHQRTMQQKQSETEPQVLEGSQQQVEDTKISVDEDDVATHQVSVVQQSLAGAGTAASSSTVNSSSTKAAPCDTMDRHPHRKNLTTATTGSTTSASHQYSLPRQSALDPPATAAAVVNG